jgi:DNA-binding transcriptional LysR family regulator
MSASTREVDLAITLFRPESSRLTVHKLTTYTVGLYASPTYLNRAGRPQNTEELADHDVISFIDDLHIPNNSALTKIHEDARVRMRSTSVITQRALTISGGGICMLPDFMVDDHKVLEPVLKDSVLIVRDVWLSINVDIENAKRIRAVRNWLFETVDARASQLRRASAQLSRP